MNIGERIQQRRKDLRMSQEDLAKKVFVTKGCISLWERNRREVPLSKLELVAKALHTHFVIGPLVWP